MTDSPGSLQGFVYAEDRDGSRSLGFKLLAPTNMAWSAEVEALARKLQACPYPETWKPAELFCSVLLEDGQRLVALARYGLRDQGQRPGGLELVGAVGDAGLHVDQARSIVHWLRRRRAEIDDLHTLAGPLPLASLPPVPVSATQGFLSLRLPAAGTLLLTGSTPDQPDENLGLLSSSAPSSWQWLPYCGPDFPFEQYSGRGPLIAWTPPYTDLALILNRPAPAVPYTAQSAHPTAASLLMPLLLILLVVNAYAWWLLPSRLPEPAEAPASPTSAAKTAKEPNAPTETRERFAAALFRLASNKAGGELVKDEQPARQVYERLVATDPDLRCDGAKGQVLVGVLDHLASYHPDRVARAIREEFSDKKGVDPDVIRIISERVKQRLEREISTSK